jgi:protein arginine kinase activator
MSLFKSLEPTDQEDENHFDGEATLSFEFPADEDLVDEMEDDEVEETLGAFDDASFEDDHIGGTTESEKEALNNLLAGVFSDDSRDEDFGPVREVPTVRCPKCNTTWDRLRQDGRAGCAHCYTTFAEQLSEVMERVQHATHHEGKQPRTAAKRRRRLEHLRTRRDHRLAMLQRRLQEALGAEKYEEAAKLRDQIKVVESTIVSDE